MKNKMASGKNNLCFLLIIFSRASGKEKTHALESGVRSAVCNDETLISFSKTLNIEDNNYQKYWISKILCHWSKVRTMPSSYQFITCPNLAG